MNFKNLSSISLIFVFSVCTVGAKDCDPWKNWKNNPPPTSPAPTDPVSPCELPSSPASSDIDYMLTTPPLQSQTVCSDAQIDALLYCATFEDDPMCSGSTELGLYTKCAGVTPDVCVQMCANTGAYCIAYLPHPYTSGLVGGLKQCLKTFLGGTCTYCFSNGDVCTVMKELPGKWFCSNTGGKGCE